MTSCWPGSACWNRCRESWGLRGGGRERSAEVKEEKEQGSEGRRVMCIIMIWKDEERVKGVREALRIVHPKIIRWVNFF